MLKALGLRIKECGCLVLVNMELFGPACAGKASWTIRCTLDETVAQIKTIMFTALALTSMSRSMLLSVRGLDKQGRRMLGNDGRKNKANAHDNTSHSHCHHSRDVSVRTK